MKYELVNKITQETIPATLHTTDTTDPSDAFVLVKIDATEELVRFENDNQEGQLFNETYAIREVETHAQADGTGTVETTEEGVKNVDTDGTVTAA